MKGATLWDSSLPVGFMALWKGICCEKELDTKLVQLYKRREFRYDLDFDCYEMAAWIGVSGNLVLDYVYSP